MNRFHKTVMTVLVATVVLLMTVITTYGIGEYVKIRTDDGSVYVGTIVAERKDVIEVKTDEGKIYVLEREEIVETELMEMNQKTEEEKKEPGEGPPKLTGTHVGIGLGTAGGLQFINHDQEGCRQFSLELSPLVISVRLWGGEKCLGYTQLGIMPLVYQYCYYDYYYEEYYCEEDWLIIPWIYGGRLYRLGNSTTFFNLGIGFPTLLGIGIEFEI